MLAPSSSSRSAAADMWHTCAHCHCCCRVRDAVRDWQPATQWLAWRCHHRCHCLCQNIGGLGTGAGLATASTPMAVASTMVDATPLPVTASSGALLGATLGTPLHTTTIQVGLSVTDDGFELLQFSEMRTLWFWTTVMGTTACTAHRFIFKPKVPPKAGTPLEFWGAIGDGDWKPHARGWSAPKHPLRVRLICDWHSFSDWVDRAPASAAGQTAELAN